MSKKFLIEAFGSPVSEEARLEDVDLEDVAAVGLQRLDATIGLDDVEKIYTGMNADVTYALMDAVETLDLDIEVQPFYPKVNDIAEEDDISYQDAWKKGFTWRNNRLFVNDEENDEQDLVDLTVRFGDAGNNGQALLQHARRKGVPALDFNLDDLVDKEAAYGDGETEAVAPDPEEAAAA